MKEYICIMDYPERDLVQRQARVMRAVARALNCQYPSLTIDCSFCGLILF